MTKKVVTVHVKANIVEGPVINVKLAIITIRRANVSYKKYLTNAPNILFRTFLSMKTNISK